MALVFVVAGFAFAAALGMARSAGGAPAVQFGLGLLAVGALALGLANDRFGLVEVQSVKSYGRGQSQKVKKDNLYERWSPVSRVAVERSQPKWAKNPILLATNDAGAPTVLFEFGGDYEAAREIFSKDPSLAVFQLMTDAYVLVVGVGGGRDVLTGLATERRKITAVEINPLMGEVVLGPFADYIGNIFDDPRVTLHIQEGRNFVAASDDEYDLIVFSMIDSWSSAAAAGAYVFNENSLYTLDAVEDFIEHLKPGGILSMTRYYQWEEALRLATMFAVHLESQGLDHIDERVMVIQNKLRRPAATVLLKNGRFTPEEAHKLLEIARRGDARILHAPHLDVGDLAPEELRRPFQTALDPEAFGATRQGFIDDRERDISPPTDDRPFFFYTQRALDMLRVNPGEHAARRLALPLLYVMVVVFGIIGAVTIFLPLYLRSGTDIRQAPHRMRSLTYFAMLGTGFMLVEISLIQRLTIFLGHPTWSFVVVLATILFASGMGSQFSTRWSEPEPGVLCRLLAVLTLLLLFYAFVIYDQFIDWMWLGKTARVALAVLVIAPAGFLMGMCFPMGIQIVRRFHETLVPWGWGVNGAFSVFASVLSIVIALAAGLRAAMLMGIACYALAYFLVRSMPDAPGKAPAAG